MRIISGKFNYREKEKPILEVDVDIRVSDLTNIDKDTAENLISGIIDESLTKYFDNCVSGMIQLSYPLEVVVESEVIEENTIGGLLWEAAQVYKRIYAEEEATSKVEAGMIEGMFNRNQTDGKFGIWGHVIEDLVFEGIQIYKDGIIHFHVGS